MLINFKVQVKHWQEPIMGHIRSSSRASTQLGALALISLLLLLGHAFVLPAVASSRPLLHARRELLSESGAAVAAGGVEERLTIESSEVSYMSKFW